MMPMSTLPLPQREREKVRLEPPLTAEGLLRRRALQRLDSAALFDPPNRSVLGLGHARNYTYRETDHRSMESPRSSSRSCLWPATKLPFPSQSRAATARAACRVARRARRRHAAKLWRGHEIGRV